MVSPRDVRELLDERPDLESGLEAVLEPDAPWSFDDVDIDSGRFGELVARGIVEETDGGYRVVDRSAIVAALEDDYESSTLLQSISIPSLSKFNPFESVSRLELALLFGALSLVVLFRTLFPYMRVFQGEHVVLSGNDPYFYRYWVELLLSDPEATLSTLPNTVLLGEPLMVATLWLAAKLFGGTPHATGLVLAWYPVVSAVITAVMVYAMAVLITQDRRIGLASVALLAVLPGHALRTSLGFADHHAFDYPWLALTLLGVVLITVVAHTDDRPNAHTLRPNAHTLGGILAIAIGVTGQVLAWEAGPLLIVPLGLYIAIEALRAVRTDESPLPTIGPVLGGIGLAAIGTWWFHDSFGWHTTLVASAPALLAIAGFGVLVAAVAAHRFNIPAALLGAAEIAGLAGGAYALATYWPEYWTRLTTSLEGRLLARRNIAEVQSLFADSGGWILLFGLLLFLGMPYLVWTTHRSRTNADWLPAVVYGWAFFGLSIIQVRFVGEFSPIIAIFCGLGFVHIAAWIDAAEPPAPFTTDSWPDLTIPRGNQLRVLVVLFLLVTSLSIIQVPVKIGQVTTPQDQYEATQWMLSYNDTQDLEYPENYVFSNWGNTRMYNYFVNGEARSYGYAQSNWDSFVTAENGTAWYHRLDGRVGFIVVDQRATSTPNALGTRLHSQYGTSTETNPGLAHYRARYVAGEYTVFTLTQGAVITGTVEPDSSVRVTTTVEIPGDTFEYSRQTDADSSGNFSVRVAYPGTYHVGEDTITVPEAAVQNGSTVSS